MNKKRVKKGISRDIPFTDLETWLQVRYPYIFKKYEEEKEKYYIYE